MTVEGSNDVLVALAQGRDDVDFLLPPSLLTAEMEKRGYRVISLSVGAPRSTMEALVRTCRKIKPKALLVAGPSAFLDHVPQVVILDDNGLGIRPVTVNVVERCAWLYKDEKTRLKKACKNIEIGVARARTRPIIEYREIKTRKKVLLLGDGESAFKAGEKLAALDLDVTLVVPDNINLVALPGIEILKGAHLQALTGYAGDFNAVFEQNKTLLEIQAGAVVVGLEASHPAPEAIPNLEKNDRVKTIPLTPGDLDPGILEGLDSIALILDRDDVETRLAVETAEALAALAAKKGINVSLFFRHMSVHGRKGQERYDMLRHLGITLIRYDEVPKCLPRDDGIEIVAKDAVLGDKNLEIKADILFLPHRTMPAPNSKRLSKVLNLPLDNEGFFQAANIRHFPVASPRKGVFFIGSGHQDLSSEEIIEEASAVASEVRSLLGNGNMLVPKILLEHDREKCAMCLTCLRTCGHAAIELNETGNSLEFLPAACWECGLCASVCPQQAITRLFNPVDEIKAAVKIASKKEDGEEPVIVFGCCNSAAHALELAGRFGLELPDRAVFIEVPCSGHVSQTEVLNGLALGAQGVIILGCHSDNCRSVRGSRSARGKAFQVAEDLKAMGLEDKFSRFYGIASNEPFRLVGIVKAACEPFSADDSDESVKKRNKGANAGKGVGANG
ncbi:MAG: hydrogenase iron-sulfur subunit [Deltaproteobacteria bacterium]|nr:hydrogenase iron-sulfur subunit [Deltaproteobacteria bacterium]